MAGQIAGHGMVHWNELMTGDVEKAKAFFQEVVGWTFEDMEMEDGGTYTILKAGDQMAGGMMDMTKMPVAAGTPAHWMTYVEVDDVDAAVGKTEAAGGTMHQPPFDVPGVGRIAIIADPTGAVLGLITPAAQQG
ncbi:MAG: VOC family protein [Alphaproteobacteria bacterium]|nr:VOC family protein [Alphaproteobacteria bacterium]